MGDDGQEFSSSLLSQRFLSMLMRTVTAWSSLPASKKGLQRQDGSTDEALLKANAIIFA